MDQLQIMQNERKKHNKCKREMNPIVMSSAQSIREKFENDAKGRKIVLYGAGRGLEYFLFRYKDNYIVDAVVDNNQKLVGKPVYEIGDRAWRYIPSFLTVIDGKTFKRKCFSNDIVVITAIKQGNEIAKELRSIGCTNYYFLSDMLDEDWKNKLREGSDIQCRDETFDDWCCRQPIVSKRVVFYEFSDFTDHTKYVALALRRICPDAELIFFSGMDYTKEWPQIRFIHESNYKNVIYLSYTAKVCLFHGGIPNKIKNPGQVFIELKHWSSITLKKFFLDVDTFRADESFYEDLIRQFSMLDYIITGSDFDTRTCRSGFAFSGEVWQIGSPRSDVLFQRKKFQKEIREYYGINENVKIMIYAPTYRFVKGDVHHTHESREIELDYEAVWKALKSRFGGEWMIMLRLHPTVAENSRNMQLPDFVVDASDYMDSGELVAASDGMISDYSSLMFEPSFIYLPVFLFATDRESYAKEYEFLIDYDELPYPIAESNEELVNNILKFDKEKYAALVDDFLEKYGVHEDGHASERAAKLISELMR